MTELIVRQDITGLLDSWIEAERNGVLFPVPLHEHWNIAGHKYKKNAFELVESLLEEGLDFLPLKVKNNPGRGRSEKGLLLSVSALEHLCMAAHTEQGRNVRELYRQSKAKWDLVKQVAPQIAQEVEVLHLQIELATKEAQKMQAERELLAFRHSIVTMCPEPVQQKVLGYTEVKTIEYIDRTITPSGDRLDGVGITYIQKRYGFKTTKEAWAWLDSIGIGKDSNRWISEIKPATAAVLDRECLPELDRIYQSDSKRQMFLGEHH
jgi:anti-repressor protein